MVYGFIGILVGLVMGVTGAGGAIISIPLFQLLVNSSLKEATVLSLLAVLFGTATNLIGKLTRVNWRLGLGLALSGTGANFATLGLKQYVPDLVIICSLIGIGIFSILNVWKTRQSSDSSEGRQSFTKILITGILLGIITTFTGLGGGVLLIPVFLNVFHLNYEDAIPTSLITIFLVSSSALLFQRDTALGLINITQVLSLGTGAVLAFLCLKIILKGFSAANVLKLRKVLFTLVTLASLAGVIWKTV